MNYKIDRNKITFKNSSFIEFDFPIEKTLDYNDLTFVLLEIIGTVYNQNVFAVNNQGIILWQIERSESLNEIGECLFTDIEIIDGKLSLFNWCGFRFTVDIMTGKILNQVFTK